MILQALPRNFNGADVVSKHLSLATRMLKIVPDIHQESFDSTPNLSCETIQGSPRRMIANNIVIEMAIIFFRQFVIAICSSTQMNMETYV
jgi:hypothetical protein